MTAFELAAVALGAVTGVLSILSQTYLWQQKEYRLDRFWAGLREGQGSLSSHPLVVLAMLAVFLSWLSFITGFGVSVEAVGWIALLFFVGHHAWRAAQRGILRPEFTLKADAVITAAAGLILMMGHLLLAPGQLFTLQVATFIFFIPGIVAASVTLVNIPFDVRKKQIVRQATRARSSRTQLTVVGITGSYGKTSTKHFLEQIVRGSGRRVAATQAHHNTPIGVSLDILAQLTPDLEIYIAELGAYRRGEIRDLCRIVQPQIGVLTAVSNQHLDLFGS
ncbi:MAG: Mur ligase family protein, partial [Patescibacteria group bacterium]